MTNQELIKIIAEVKAYEKTIKIMSESIDKIEAKIIQEEIRPRTEQQNVDPFGLPED